jgi:hypothetical protein
MGRIPGAGTFRGAFELLVPGVFLLLNIVAAVYSAHPTEPQTSIQKQIEVLANNLAGATLLVIPFGYLIGVSLRLVKTKKADSLSARFLKHWEGVAKVAVPEEGDLDVSSREARALLLDSEFPYTDYIVRVTIPALPKCVREDLERFEWEKITRSQHLNFRKVVVTCANERAAAELSAAESLSRYVASMLYGLSAAITVLFVSALVRAISWEVEAWVLIAITAYAVGVWIILWSFRYLRLKEVEAILATCYQTAGEFLPRKGARSEGRNQDRSGEEKRQDVGP